jgi:purine-binding chemotaxis protein CheW
VRRHSKGTAFVGFLVADVEYAVHIAGVREIVNPREVVVLPRRPPGILGVAEFRSDIVPVLDLRLRFGLVDAPITRRTKWLMINAGVLQIALQVEHVVGVFNAELEEQKKAPPMLARDELCRVLFVTKRKEHMVFALDTSPFEELAREVAAAPQELTDAPQNVRDGGA